MASPNFVLDKVSTVESKKDRSSETDKLDKLLRRMKTTKSNRFKFAKRLERKAQNKSSTISVLSLLTVLAGVYLLAFSGELTQTAAQFIGVFSIGVSLVSIFISHESPVKELSRRAADAHRCGREVSHIYRRTEAGQETLKTASRKYETIVSRYDDNHDHCDYMNTLLDYKDEFSKDLKEKGANWLNGIVYSHLSAWRPAITAFSGVVLVIAICGTIPLFNNYFLKGNIETVDRGEASR